VLRRHPRLTSLAVRLVAIVVVLAVLDQLVPDLAFFVRVLAAGVVSLVVGALVERSLGPGAPAATADRDR